MNKKQVIRLNENKLKQIVMESVKRVLNEMDPRTYSWYSDERKKQANGDRPLSDAQKRKGTTPSDLEKKSHEGLKAAQNAFNKKYGFMSNRSIPAGRELEYYGMDTNKDDYSTIWDETNDAKENGKQIIQNRYGVYNPDTDEYSLTYKHYGKDDYSNPLRFVDVMKNASDIQAKTSSDRIARQMAKGDGKYVKGKGWVDESINKAVKNAILKVLY